MRGKQIAGGLCLCAAAWAQKITVGKNVLVSQAYPQRQHYEVQLAADPNHAERMIGCSIIGPAETGKSQGDHKTIVYVTTDSGKSWTPTLEVGPGLIARDPSCTFGPDGTAYFTAFGFPRDSQFLPTMEGKALWLYRSKDGGKTWAKPTVLPIIDREFVTVDNSSSPYKGRVYVVGNGGLEALDHGHGLSDLMIFRSEDGGASFRPPVQFASSGNHRTIEPGNSVVLSDGTVLWPYCEMKNYYRADGVAGMEENKGAESNAWMKALVSSDGGQHFSDFKVGDYFLKFYGNVSGVPSVAVDASNGPFKDRVYVVWPDMRSGRTEILLAWSADKGKTWSRPVTVNDDWWPANASGGPDHEMPAVAVNSAGVVGVSWYDRRESADNNGWRVHFSASLDGGDTFSASVKVAEAPYVIDPNQPQELEAETHPSGSWFVGPGAQDVDVSLGAFRFVGGDTAGLVADANGVFHALWVDNRTGLTQVWTADVSVEGQARAHGSADLEDLTDVTDMVMLDFENCHYDPEHKKVTMTVYVLNTSQKTVAGPLKVKVLRLTSVVGAPELEKSDNALHGPGALLDFSSLVEEAGLKPGARSKGKTVEVSLSERAKAYHPMSSRYAVSFVNFRARVFANSR